MPQSLKFHLDEHVDPAIASGLRRRGIDVTTTIEVGLRGADDTDHIAFALAAGRVIVTHDDDFLSLHGQGVAHAGIAYCHQHARSIGQIIGTLTLMWQVLEPAELKNRVQYLGRVRHKPLKKHSRPRRIGPRAGAGQPPSCRP